MNVTKRFWDYIGAVMSLSVTYAVLTAWHMCGPAAAVRVAIAAVAGFTCCLSAVRSNEYDQ